MVSEVAVRGFTVPRYLPSDDDCLLTKPIRVFLGSQQRRLFLEIVIMDNLEAVLRDAFAAPQGRMSLALLWKGKR